MPGEIVALNIFIVLSMKRDFAPICVFFQISSGAKTFAEAEVDCMNSPDTRYKTQLVWTKNRKVLDYLSILAEKKMGHSEFWVGLDRRNGFQPDTWTSRFEFNVEK